MTITTAVQAKQIIQDRVAQMQSIYDDAMQTMASFRNNGWAAIEWKLRETEEQEADKLVDDL